MVELDESELETDFEGVIARVEAGETFLIVRNGRPVYRVTGAGDDSAKPLDAVPDQSY